MDSLTELHIIPWEIVQLILVQCDPVPVRFVCRQWRDLIPYKRFDSDYCTRAAENGHLECLKWAHESGCPWNDDTCLYAALNGRLECLKYAHENGCPWSKPICLTYAKNNEIKQYINSH